MNRQPTNRPSGEAASSVEWQGLVSNVLVDAFSQLQRTRPGERYVRPNPDEWRRLRAQYEDLQDKRVLVVEFGEQSVVSSLLSLFLVSVDVAQFEPSHLVLSRYESGERTHSMRQRTYSRRRAGAGILISMFVEGEDDRLGEVDLILIVGPNAAPRTARDIVDLLEVPYIAIADEAEYEYAMLRFWVGASTVYLKSTRIVEEWSASHLVPAEPINTNDIAGVLRALDHVVKMGSSQLRSEPADAHTYQRVLLVSYFAPPTTPVSVQRLKYWFDALPSLASDRERGLRISWLTATRGAESEEGMIVVPDPGELKTSEPGWDFIEKLRGLELDRLSASWTDRIQEVAGTWGASYDTVIMSGNPFHYFRLARFFRDLWGAKVILDFRDPYAWNPRFNYSVEQRAFLMELEREMVQSADAVVSVNSECLSEIAPAVKAARKVVSNGYSENIVESVADRVGDNGAAGLVRLVYTGTVFRNLPLDELLDALPENRMVLDHYGRDYSVSQAVQNHPLGRAHGLVPYEEMVKRIYDADAGIVMTSGESSTQTTKLFDYIACDLDIIIVTDGEPRTGNLDEVTQGLDAVYWVKNEPAKLRAFFASYRPSRVRRPQRANFSRRHQTERLLDLIFELEDG